MKKGSAPRADTPATWAHVRISASQVEQIRLGWTAPEVGPTLRAAWAAFLATDQWFRERLLQANLSKVGARQLIEVVHVGESVKSGIADCTPDIAGLSLGVKAKVYFLAVLLGGLFANGWRPGTQSEAAVGGAVGFAMRGAGCYAAAAAAVDEIRRRGALHVGYPAALLAMPEPWLPLFGAAAEKIAEPLTTATRKRTKKLLEKQGLAWSEIRDLLDGLPGQAALTISQTWGDVDPLELLARAIEGRLDIVHQKIIDDTADAARPQARWHTLAVSFDPAQKVPGRPPTPASCGGLETPGGAGDVAWARLKELVNGDRALERWLQAEEGGGSREDVARRLGCSPAMVDKHRRRAKDLAKTLLS